MGNPGGRGGGGGLCVLGVREAQDSADTGAGPRALSQSLPLCSSPTFHWFGSSLTRGYLPVRRLPGPPPPELGLAVEGLHGNQSLQQVSVVFTSAGVTERWGVLAP